MVHSIAGGPPPAVQAVFSGVGKVHASGMVPARRLARLHLTTDTPKTGTPDTDGDKPEKSPTPDSGAPVLAQWSGSCSFIRPSAVHRNLVHHLIKAGAVKEKDRSRVGIALTNAHVATGATNGLYITLHNGSQVGATLLRSPVNGRPVLDPITDTALLVVTLEEDLPTLTLADGATLHTLADRESDGTPIYALGYPRGLWSVTDGIISSGFQSIGGPFELIQISAPINPGNSGGPLVSTDGIQLGVNSSMLTDSQAMGFAIPVNLMLLAAINLYTTGSNQWSVLPIGWSPFGYSEQAASGFRAQTGLEHGAAVAFLPPDLPLKKLQLGDVVTHMQPLLKMSRVKTPIRRALKQIPWVGKEDRTRVRLNEAMGISALLGRFFPLPPDILVAVGAVRPTKNQNGTTTWGEPFQEFMLTVPLQMRQEGEPDEGSPGQSSPSAGTDTITRVATAGWNSGTGLYIGPRGDALWHNVG